MAKTKLERNKEAEPKKKAGEKKEAAEKEVFVETKVPIRLLAHYRDKIVPE